MANALVCGQARWARGVRCTSRSASSARASRSSTGRLGTVPPASNRATADWVMPALVASVVWVQSRCWGYPAVVANHLSTAAPVPSSARAQAVSFHPPSTRDSDRASRSSAVIFFAEAGSGGPESSLVIPQSLLFAARRSRCGAATAPPALYEHGDALR